jgi:ferrous iron transport protein B
MAGDTPHGPAAGRPPHGATALLVGNANVGKSVIFGKLTGRYAVVSNYPGTTIELTSAPLTLTGGDVVTLVDTPGVNGLLPFSEDEKVTQRIILDEPPAFIVQVADAKNLDRSLRLTLELLELDVPLIVALNMSDEAAARGMTIDAKALAETLALPIVRTSAPEGEGIPRLLEAASRLTRRHAATEYGPVIGGAIASIARLLDRRPHASRLLATLYLAGDPFLPDLLRGEYPPETLAEVGRIAAETQSRFSRPLSLVMAAIREKTAGRLAAGVTTSPSSPPGTLAQRIGVWTRRPLTGIPIFLGVIFALYLIVGHLAAGTAVDFMEKTFFGAWLNPLVGRLVDLLPWPLARDLLMGRFGLVTMGLTYALAIVLPIVGAYFLCFGVLEDSGYLPRLSVMSDRLFRRIGLNGKAILPMVLGLGCGTMATLTARILETGRERLIVTLLLALGIPCSAQLGVMLAIMSGMSPWAALTVIGVVLSQLVLVGWLASLVIPGESSDFILELPPIRLPRAGNLFVKTGLRVEWFLKEAIPLFLLGTLVLFAIDRVGLLDRIIELGRPLVTGWLGLPPEAATILVMGFFRRDYGAAGLMAMVGQGGISVTQVVVALVVLTLFIPCVANFLVIVKEQGPRRAMAIAGFVFPFALLVGGLLNLSLRLLGVSF